MDKLEYLNCEGCEHLTDNAFKYLLLSSTNLNINKSQICIKNPMEDCKIQQVELDLCKDCVLKNNIEDYQEFQEWTFRPNINNTRPRCIRKNLKSNSHIDTRSSSKGKYIIFLYPK